MSIPKAAEVAKVIKDALILKQISYWSLFVKLDSNGNGLLSFAEFNKGMDEIVKLSPTVKQQLFALMDVNSIGMVDYESFLEIMQVTSVSRPKSKASDTFKWEEDVIEKIREYILSNRLTVEEAFKTFDKDFDGKISKEDLKWTIVNVLKYDADTI